MSNNAEKEVKQFASSEVNPSHHNTSSNLIEETKTEEIIEDLRPIVYGNRVALILARLPRLMAAARPMAYASEVGESLRPIIPPLLVRSLYGLSWAYVFADTAIKTYDVRKEGKMTMMIYCSDTLAWHSIGSMALPALTIHTIVKYSMKGLLKIPKMPEVLCKWGPVGLGLCSIPFIIHPLDHATDWLFNNTVRRGYRDQVSKLREQTHEHHQNH